MWINIINAASSAATCITTRCSSTSAREQKNLQTMGIMIAAVILVLVPDDISHLLLMVVGAAGYLLLQALHPFVQVPPIHESRFTQSKCVVPAYRARLSCAVPKSVSPPQRDFHRELACPQREATKKYVKPEVWMPSSVPVAAPKFRGNDWESEVKELLGQIAPTPKCEATVAYITRSVKNVILPSLPQAEVMGFVSSNLTNGKAFGVAVPEVDIVIRVDYRMLQGWLYKRPVYSTPTDIQKIQKHAIRAFTDQLVGRVGFKFRRSAFNNSEPKVTLLAPTQDGSSETVPVNLSVNSVVPLRNSALIAECGRVDPRAKDLILMVKRWAKDRGVCHAAKGHFSPYEWTLLAMYFMQVGLDDGDALISSADVFEISGKCRAKLCPRPQSSGSSGRATSVATLFPKFAQFYSTQFDWEKESVSVRLAKRGPPNPSLFSHVISLQELGVEARPSIEDPFDAANNLGACMTVMSFPRLREELSRAVKMCSQGASLSALLEPWAPSEHGDAQTIPVQ